jgi:ribose 1,5-bisphosphokinase PhnN
MEFLNAVGPWLVGIFIFGVPIALAWWLSDGFSNVTFSSETEIRVVPNSTGHHSNLAVVNIRTNVPISYLD